VAEPRDACYLPLTPTDVTPTLDQIAAALAAHEPRQLPPPPSPRDRAAVAIVLAGQPHDLELCLIRRAERTGDPWSGHVALPGGRIHVEDDGARAAAERETLEEVGLRLQPARHLGALDEMPLGRDPSTPAVLSSFVWHVGDFRPVLRPDPGEVAHAAWVPLRDLWNAAHETTIEWPWRGETLAFPGIRWDGAVLWGLTLRVLGTFGALVGQPLPVSDRDPMSPVR
jgi:8-oxo-dGTP pyrophosphatase MutT (NUDIX family)